jgi:hypothetical protein
MHQQVKNSPALHAVNLNMTRGAPGEVELLTVCTSRRRVLLGGRRLYNWHLQTGLCSRLSEWLACEHRAAVLTGVGRFFQLFRASHITPD